MIMGRKAADSTEDPSDQQAEHERVGVRKELNSFSVKIHAHRHDGPDETTVGRKARPNLHEPDRIIEDRRGFIRDDVKQMRAQKSEDEA